MNRDDVAWRGYWPAAPTPFTADGALDEAGWRALLRLYAAQGVHGVLVNGTTGEWFAQTPAERRRVAEIAVAELGGRIPVVIGCGAFTAAECAEFGEHARAIGADGVLTTPPPYVHPSQAEILDFYRRVTDAVDLPLMVYNWPRGTAVDITVATAERLADLPNVVAIKDSSGDELKVARTCEALAGSVRVFGRFIHRRGMAVMAEFGGDGNIDGGGLGAPFAVPFYAAFWAGDLTAARAWSARYERLVELLVKPDYSARFASPTAQLKAAMGLLGQPGGHVRPPLLPLDDPTLLARLAAALAEAGLTETEAPHSPAPAA
ncbi:dihydrodipicolinate synthase family protein [Streptomyces sp. 8K308]|uniref:dihydrodipicolinate synthase family protein n=1 Tax=Streptomyces sp. 8K308 TaxID=2530388 RepID=UPI001050930E|nr:dihydrodipicolinate synthase family protein [Streptomyces sp. 8K308]TDC19670.1 dihydrodipicolinate synthase family protein [Streptomyces sp. 8K308]